MLTVGQVTIWAAENEYVYRLGQARGLVGAVVDGVTYGDDSRIRQYLWQAKNCPFAESEAIPDTLDPKGYYPLAVGNVWEYEVQDEFRQEFLRLEVTHATLVKGQTYYEIQRVSYRPHGRNALAIIDTTVSYQARADSGLVYASSARGPFFLITRFDLPFNTCGEISNPIIEGGYDREVVIGNEAVHLLAVKSEDYIGNGAAYGYGIGAIRRWGDPDYNAKLTYALLPEAEYGAPFSMQYTIVAAEEAGVLPDALRLSVFPSPARQQATVAFSLPQAGEVHVSIHDMLGREVESLIAGAPYAAGEHRLSLDINYWAAGVYVVRMVQGGVQQTARLVVVR